MASRRVVFVHGAWVTSSCWENFGSYFERRGYQCLAPAWPHKNQPVAELRRHPPAELSGLGLIDIADHYNQIIRALDTPPILIGHSYGGLFVQMLLDWGLGAAGIAIDSAPPRGVLPFYPTVIRSNLRILST